MEKLCSKQSIIILMCLILVLFSSIIVKSQEPEWFAKLKQIQVMQSTRQDVERIFSFPNVIQIRGGKTSSRTIDYEFKGGSLYVSYSIGKCSLENNTRGYDADNDIVVEVYLFLFEPIKTSRLNLDLKNFEKHKESDTNALTYSNDEIGVQYTGGKKTVSSIKFYPADRYDYLYCRNVLNKAN